MSQPLRIGVIGSHDCGAETAAAARRVGSLIAEGGAVLVSGGLGGVMAAAAEGARAAGGTTVGILPGADPRAANPGIEIAIPTGLGEARNALVVGASDAVVAIAGGWGTSPRRPSASRTRSRSYCCAASCRRSQSPTPRLRRRP